MQRFVNLIIKKNNFKSQEITPYDLININIVDCDTCVSMASTDYQIVNEKPSDKSVILFSMNVKSLKLDIEEEQQKRSHSRHPSEIINSYKTEIPVLISLRKIRIFFQILNFY